MRFPNAKELPYDRNELWKLHPCLMPPPIYVIDYRHEMTATLDGRYSGLVSFMDLLIMHVVLIINESRWEKLSALVA
ncbi:unnamed protein product [Linum trigynum]|uniref:Uncharacterized protein n=1 Tax=Linum trigynum TaxID=586398 RepID=A0AAV2D3T3_9ROSI